MVRTPPFRRTHRFLTLASAATTATATATSATATAATRLDDVLGLHDVDLFFLGLPAILLPVIGRFSDRFELLVDVWLQHVLLYGGGLALLREPVW